MAKIGVVPSAQQLYATYIRTGDKRPFPHYGPRLIAVASPGMVELQEAGSFAQVAAWSEGAEPTIRLENFPLKSARCYVPYVNAFLRDAGWKVHRNVRQNTYSLRPGPLPIAPLWLPAYSLRPGPLPIAPLWLPEPIEPEPEPEPSPVPVAVEVLSNIGVIDIAGIELLPVAAVQETATHMLIGDIIVTRDDYDTLSDAYKLRQAGEPAYVLITGPSGAAKTAVARAFAASRGLPFLKVDGGSIRSADDWSGTVRQDRDTKVWAHQWSAFAQVLRRGQPAMVLIDEINRTESPQALNALLGLLDAFGQLLVPDAHDVLTMPDGIMLVATANIGPEFIGTLPLDGAVRQRFGFGIRMEFLPMAVEAKLLNARAGLNLQTAERMVKIADMQRNNRMDMQLYPSGGVISTRLLLDVARRVAACGTDPRTALWATLRGQFENGDEDALRICVETQFPTDGEV